MSVLGTAQHATKLDKITSASVLLLKAASRHHEDRQAFGAATGIPLGVEEASELQCLMYTIDALSSCSALGLWIEVRPNGLE